VGRVWPRHEQRGRPLNEAVRHQSKGLVALSSVSSPLAPNPRKHTSSSCGQSVRSRSLVQARRSSRLRCLAESQLEAVQRNKGAVPLLAKLVNWSSWRRQLGPPGAYGGMMPNNTFERTSLLSSRSALGQRAAQLGR
jgi:hypothetical protein